jgi:hypothetical protein
MLLTSARAIKQELDEQLHGRNGLMEKVSHRVSGFGTPVTHTVFSPPLAKGITRLGARNFGVTIRVYPGRDALVRPVLQRFAGRGEIEIVRGVAYRRRAPAPHALIAGQSIGHVRITAGTLGGFVADSDGVYVLSNNHVLANTNAAEPFDPILLPGPSDARKLGSYRVIAHLHRWFDLRPHTTDNLDAAIAMLVPGQAYKPSFVPGVGRVERTPIAHRFAAHGVFKFGRTTQLTRGVVSAFELDDVVVDYGTAQHPYLVRFANQLEFVATTPTAQFSAPGDSGAVIYDEATRQPVALLFGGGPDADGRDRTLGHFLPEVLDALTVELL